MSKVNIKEIAGALGASKHQRLSFKTAKGPWVGSQWQRKFGEHFRPADLQKQSSGKFVLQKRIGKHWKNWRNSGVLPNVQSVQRKLLLIEHGTASSHQDVGLEMVKVITGVLLTLFSIGCRKSRTQSQSEFLQLVAIARYHSPGPGWYCIHRAPAHNEYGSCYRRSDECQEEANRDNSYNSSSSHCVFHESIWMYGYRQRDPITLGPDQFSPIGGYDSWHRPICERNRMDLLNDPIHRHLYHDVTTCQLVP